MENSADSRGFAGPAVLAACLLAGCISDHDAIRPMAPTACPDGLALRVETIGLSYAVVRVDPCADKAVRYILEREIGGDTTRDEFVTDAGMGWIRSARYSIFPGSTSHYRITAFFKDSTRLESNLLTVVYPDSAQDFAPIAVGRSYEYAMSYSSSTGWITPTGSSTADTGTFAFTVLSRADSSGSSVYQVEYRESIVSTNRTWSATDTIGTTDTLRLRDTTRCMDDGDTVRCEPLSGSHTLARFPWAGTHAIGRPHLGLVMPAGRAATACAHEANQVMPYGTGRQTIHLPGVGMVESHGSSTTPHSKGSGDRMRISLIGLDGNPVDYREYSDLCSRDFPPLPAQ